MTIYGHVSGQQRGLLHTFSDLGKRYYRSGHRSFIASSSMEWCLCYWPRPGRCRENTLNLQNVTFLCEAEHIRCLQLKEEIHDGCTVYLLRTAHASLSIPCCIKGRCNYKERVCWYWEELFLFNFPESEEVDYCWWRKQTVGALIYDTCKTTITVPADAVPNNAAST